MAFGFTPKHSENLFLDTFTPQQFLIIAIESAKKLGWDISFISETGFIAYLNKGHFHWNAEITFKIDGKHAVLKSESVGNEMIDWGRNKKNVLKFTEASSELKYSITSDELDVKFEELKPNLVLGDHDILNQEPTTGLNKFLDFFSLFTPRDGYFITPILVNLNILVYVLMVCTGVNFFLPDGESLLMWGANFRPLTMNGEWWRLLTNCFLHIGILHILMNMYALLYIGLLLEPRIGRIKFASAYLITGITASITSLWWHDFTISAGASGAIFGLYGVFLALLSTNLIEKAARVALLTSIGIFVGYNLLNGMKDGIDNAAHIGGLIGGLIIGFSFYPSLAKPAMKLRNFISGLAAYTVIVALSFFLILHSANPVGKFDTLAKEFAKLEEKAMKFYRVSQNSSNDICLKAIKEDGIPNWRECMTVLNRMDSIKNLPMELSNKSILLKKYCDYRITSFELLEESIELNTNMYTQQIGIYNEKIELIIKKLNGEAIPDSSLNVNLISEITPRSPKDVLYVVDGKPVDNISKLNPETVKSILYLDEEKSFQLYGERGKAGALIIETKK